MTPTSTQAYTYSTGAWGDRLSGTTYDGIGNPLTYSTYALTWSDRELVEMNRNYGQSVTSFTYNDEGIRTSKNVGGTVHTYVLNGSQIVSETWGQRMLLYLYDESGAPMGLQYRQSSYAAGVFDTFYFEKNIFGDIVAVYSEAGVKIGTYTYDAWGNCTTTVASGNTTLQSTILRTYNPFRYRGYFYDTETGLYYLQSRYYNPATGRFLNPDNHDVLWATPTELTDKNLYAYCDNNPVMRVDYDGMFWGTVFDVISLVFSVVDVIEDPSDPWAWAGLVGDTVDLVPFVSGVGETTKAVSASLNIVDNIHDTQKIAENLGDIPEVTQKVAKKIHGNSLDCPAINYGYVLLKNDTDEILKYGESIKGTKRYTEKFYTENNCRMLILCEGTKREIHEWQHNKIVDYFNKYKKRPPKNNSFY